MVAMVVVEEEEEVIVMERRGVSEVETIDLLKHTLVGTTEDSQVYVVPRKTVFRKSF